jgi:DNA-binding beta-propeller fold protein YncE
MQPRGGRISDQWSRAAITCLLVLFLLAATATSADATTITRVKVWGSWGQGDGQMYLPTYAAVDRSGHVYVSDEQNSRVVKFSDTGEFLLAWGWGVKTEKPRLETCTEGCRRALDGAGPGQFEVPGGIAYSSNRIYVSDPRNNRIQVFTPTGRLLNIWGRAGSRNGQFQSPIGVATDRDGRVYVADTLNSRIQKFSAGGKFLDKWGAPGGGTHNLSFPRAVAVDGSGHVYVADTANNRAVKYTTDGHFLRMWGLGVATGFPRFEICTARCRMGTSDGPLDIDGRLDDPVGIATDGDGNVYVSDAVAYQIEAFRRNGDYRTTLEVTTLGVPWGVAVDRSDYLYGIYSHGKVLKARLH